jgi:predicted GIY-YIG superfamily endonuclease
MYVYVLRSIQDPEKTYVGATSDYERRFKEHNAGASAHTSKFRPWKTELVVWFSDRDKASRFEKYLKSGSGRAFASRHF